MNETGYSAYDRDVSQRILHSETRIKNWVIGGVLANLIVLIGVGAPLVYYLGQLSAQSTGVAEVMTKTGVKLEDHEIRIQKLEFEKENRK